MRRLLLIVLLASMFVGCGSYELKKKGEVEKVTTVHILDVGAFEVVGDIDWTGSGALSFTEKTGMEITTHLQRCVIVTSVPKPAPPQVKAPAPAPVQTPKKIPEKKPSK